MFNCIKEVSEYYKLSNLEKHKIIYEEFEKNAKQINYLNRQFKRCNGLGELPFSYNWYLLVNEMNNKFKFLEIGVYKGRICCLIELLSKQLNKEVEITGITPLSTLGDKYSKYKDLDYLKEIQNNYEIMSLTMDNTNIIKGLSQDKSIINNIKNEEYDIIFIDGSHDYQDVCDDIENYLPKLKVNGYLVLDDSSKLLENPYGKSLGHEEVCLAVQDKLDNNKKVKHLFAVGHNRVWRKIN